MKSRTITRTLRNPDAFAPLLAIHGAREYDTAVNQLNQLVDEIGDNPRDPRYRFIETLSVLIEAYDAEHHALADASGLEVLKYLMEQHSLTQSDLPRDRQPRRSIGSAARKARTQRTSDRKTCRAVSRLAGRIPANTQMMEAAIDLERKGKPPEWESQHKPWARHQKSMRYRNIFCTLFPFEDQFDTAADSLQNEWYFERSMRQVDDPFGSRRL